MTPVTGRKSLRAIYRPSKRPSWKNPRTLPWGRGCGGLRSKNAANCCQLLQPLSTEPSRDPEFVCGKAPTTLRFRPPSSVAAAAQSEGCFCGRVRDMEEDRKGWSALESGIGFGVDGLVGPGTLQLHSGPAVPSAIPSLNHWKPSVGLPHSQIQRTEFSAFSARASQA